MLEQRSIDQLTPYKHNARVHSEEQVEQIAQSIKEFGFVNPVLIDDQNTILAGHGRVEAAKKLNIQKVPTIKIEHLSEKEKKAYILADNKLAEMSYWDYDILESELSEIQELNFDIKTIGFEPNELKHLEKNKEKVGVKEIDLDAFKEFKHICPRCSFQFDD